MSGLYQVFSPTQVSHCGGVRQVPDVPGLRAGQAVSTSPSNYNHDLDLPTCGAVIPGQCHILLTLKPHGGARHDRFDYDLVNHKLPAASTGYEASVVTPKYGAIWNVLPAVELHANIAQGFRSPAAEQTSTSGSLARCAHPAEAAIPVSIRAGCARMTSVSKRRHSTA